MEGRCTALTMRNHTCIMETCVLEPPPPSLLKYLWWWRTGGGGGCDKGEVRGGGLRVTTRFKVVYTALVKVNALSLVDALFAKKKGYNLNCIAEVTFKRHRNGNNLTLGFQSFRGRFAGLTRRCWRIFLQKVCSFRCKPSDGQQETLRENLQQKTEGTSQ